MHKNGGTKGVNLWISAPSSRLEDEDLITTDLSGSYTSNFSSTSAAAPMVTGVVALLRQKYPNFSWRDIKLILAESARKISSDKRNYAVTGKMYSDKRKNQAYDKKTGFGLVDAAAAFELAKNWIQLPKMKTITYERTKEIATPLDHTFAISELNVPSNDIKFIESVTLEVSFLKTKENVEFTQRDLILESPDGKMSAFFEWDGKSPFLINSSNLRDGIDTMRLLTNSFLGSRFMAGNWKLMLKQNPENRTVSAIKSWKLIVRGH